MPIESHVADPRTGKIAWVDDAGGNEDQALIVASRELKQYTTFLRFFTNDDYGFDMAQNAAHGGTPASVHNGTDNVQWTAAALSGTWDFASTDQANLGTKSIDGTATQNNNEAQFVAAASVDSASYVALTGHIYITGWTATGIKEVQTYGYDTTSPCLVGAVVDIGDYVNTDNYNTWQQFSIPFEDLAMTGCWNALRLMTVSTGGGAAPNYYLDDIELQQTGSAIVYTVEPDAGTWLHVQTIRISLADNAAGTLADATMPNLSYNSILGVTAASVGITYQRVQADGEGFTSTARQLSDWLVQPGAEVTNHIADGTNTFLTIDNHFLEPEILKAESEDKLRILIQDDLSSLLMLRMAAVGREENRCE